jgi:hypothetical protein
LWDEKKTCAVLYMGIAEWPFELSFQLADFVVVKAARHTIGYPLAAL